jgi:hypothetical protein
MPKNSLNFKHNRSDKMQVFLKLNHQHTIFFSTLSSGLNSLAAVTWEDAVKHSSLGKRISAGRAELVIKVLGIREDHYLAAKTAIRIHHFSRKNTKDLHEELMIDSCMYK